MTDNDDEVPCLVCKRPCRSPEARARRIGGRCWRKLRRKAREIDQAALFTPGTAWSIVTKHLPGVS